MDMLSLCMEYICFYFGDEEWLYNYAYVPDHSCVSVK